ncbi:MAG: SGNH/GDSL hydrolase family protein [Spirochaetota bacterium]
MKNGKLKSFLIGLAITATSSLSAQSLSELFQKPGVIGDSLSQGFYGATVEKKTQDWAYPVLVTKQANSSLTYNTLKGPYLNFEDYLKDDCGVFCTAASILGGNESTVSLPSHAGITGADYTNALYTSGSCQDTRATKWEREWYWKTWYHYTYRWVKVEDCQEPDKFHQYGLRGAGTQIEIMEKVKPSFVFATVAANHVLCTALSTTLDCLDENRFLTDFRESMRRIQNIDSVKGGVLFTVPNVTSIAFLEEYTDPEGRADHSGLKAFFRGSVSGSEQVLDKAEIEKITEFTNMLNGEIKAQAAAMGFAIADAEAVFQDIKENGRMIEASNGYSPGSAGTNWPMPGKPGVFSLDGVHPNMYGHAVMANELIEAINQKYGVSIPKVSEYTAWYNDSLNRNPVNMKDYLNTSLFGQFVTWLIGVFV